MVKLRLIPALFIKNGLIVRSESFKLHQNIGNIINQAHRYNEWDVDELVYIDISREKSYDMRRDDHKVRSYSSIEEIIRLIGSVCFMPLTIGGGIRTMGCVKLRIRNGADKITLNTAAFETPGLIAQVADRYGSQCVVISIDYRMDDGRPMVYTHAGSNNTGRDVLDWARECVDRGAGEIFLNSIDRDGMACGYDLKTIASVVSAVNVPVIACGGAGDFHDFVEVAQETGVSAVAAGNIFHFTERSYPRAKQLMKRAGLNVRG